MKLFEAIIKRLRTDPFRTKLQPDFMMNWGIERKDEPYPVRNKQEVEIFDLKKFVTEEKSKKMANSGGVQFKNPNPFKPNIDNSFNSFGNINGSLNSKDNFNSLDIDSMLKDLDNKFKELDRQEAERKKMGNQGLLENNDLPKLKNNNNFGGLETFNNNSFNNFDNNSLNNNFSNFNSSNNFDLFNNSNLNSNFNKLNNDADTKSQNNNKNLLNNNLYENINDKNNDEVDLINNKVHINEKTDHKPIINVDNDSKIIDDNVISDDEFFDDFFGDD